VTVRFQIGTGGPARQRALGHDALLAGQRC
jgi:hypothetical protein